MIAQVASCVPESLAAYRGGVAVGPGGAGAVPLSCLREPAVFDAALSAFDAGLDPCAGAATGDRRALVSYWSQFYFAALATPALTALVRLGRPLPLAFDTVSLELDLAGRPSRLLVGPGTPGTVAAPTYGVTQGFGELLDGHLRPFVALCHARCGLAPRVLWGNAAAIFDYVAGELGRTPGGPCEELAACLEWRGGSACARNPLAQGLRPGALGRRRRRVCCLRRRLPSVPSCDALCPLGCVGER